MARVKSIAQRRHRKIKAATKGFKQARSRRIKPAKEAVLHAGQYAYEGRKLRKRDLRSLWIVRLSGALSERGMKYSRFIKALQVEKVELNRKMLSELAIRDPKAFDAVVEKVRKSL